jgi:hypothetical protein
MPARPVPKVTNKKTTDAIADEVRDLMKRKPYLLEAATLIADDTVSELSRALPGIEPGVIGAVLLRASSHLGTHLLAALADEPLKADSFHLLAMNAMAVAGERMYEQPPAPPTAEQDGAAADAEAYRELRDEIAATMGDEWDLDEAEISILIKYVRWLAAGQPRDEDGYPIRRETYPAADLAAEREAREADVRAVAETCSDFGNDEGPRGIRQLYARFADRITAQAGDETDGSGT